MFELKVTSHFAAAHQLRFYGGDCEQLHGHNWKVDVWVRGEHLAPDGMLVDFRRVKEAVREVVGRLDHCLLNELQPFADSNPSSENIARHVFHELSRTLNTDRFQVSRVTAWESETAGASYWEEPGMTA